MKWPIALILVCLLGGCSFPERPTLKIACASNLETGIDSIIKVFEQQSGIECELTPNASGLLSTQIQEGAPFDIFISANYDYVAELYEKELCTEPQYIKSSYMVLVNLTSNETLNPDSLLLDSRTSRIGIADPEIAPYGMAAKEYLESAGLWKQLETKLVFAESLAQLNMYISSGSVDAAFTSEAFVQQRPTKHLGLNTSNYTPIKQYFVQVFTEGKVAPGSDEFVTFLLSDDCSDILAYFGY